MPTCPNPTCQKEMPRLAPVCPHCRADLSLLVDVDRHVHGGLERAADLTRSGALGEAVWAYLEVLEVDPDNPTARQQVGQVVTAVRQFDRADPGRRWLRQLQKQARQRRTMVAWEKSIRGVRATWWVIAGMVLVAAAALVTGYWLGFQEGRLQPPGPALPSGPEPTEAGAPATLSSGIAARNPGPA
jgi:hypothetical protein